MSDFVKRFNSMPDRVKEMFADAIECLTDKEDFCSIYFLVRVIDFPTECESPIEQILWYALRLMALKLNRLDIIFDSQVGVEVNGHHYRLDLFFEEDTESNDPVMVAVECDGHDFHEKTKEQVEKRNVRDMELKKAGVDVLHYSGSQIYNKPYNCAKEIIDYVSKLLSDKRRE